MTNTLPIAFVLLLMSGALGAQQGAQQTQSPGQPPTAQPQQVPPAQAGQTEATEEKEDLFAGYKQVADLKQKDFQKLESDTLPYVERLGRENPCANASPIAKRIEALRKAAKEWVAAYQKYNDKWTESNEKDIEENSKLGADVNARKDDIPDLIKAGEQELKEYERKRNALAAGDENARREWADTIEKARVRLDTLRKATDASDFIVANLKLSREYWEAKRESIKKDREIIFAVQLAYGARYDAIVQGWRTACTQRSAPKVLTVLKDLGLEQKK